MSQTFESLISLFLEEKLKHKKNFKMLARKALMSIPVRYGHVVAGKPRVHISPMEKAVHLALITCGITFTPLYILANVKIIEVKLCCLKVVKNDKSFSTHLEFYVHSEINR